MLIRRFVQLVAIAASLAGCGTTSPFSNIVNGEPIIDDGVWFLGHGKYQTTDALKADYLPAECVEGATQYPPASASDRRINNCMEAMRNVIDRRYQHWVDSLQTAVGSGNTAVDLSVIGMGAAGALLGGITTKILSAASSSLVGSKKAIDNDVFYNNAIAIVVLQMEKDRSCWGSVIETRLAANSYLSLKQGFNDLIAYSRAGSFARALVNMQVSAGAQASANLTTLQATKASVPGVGTNSVPTCGVPTSPGPSGPGLVTVVTRAGSPPAVVTMPFVAPGDPLVALRATDDYVTGSVARANAGIAALTAQLNGLPKSEKVKADLDRLDAATTAVKAANDAYFATTGAIKPSPLAVAYATAERNLAGAATAAEITTLKPKLTDAYVPTIPIHDQIADARRTFDTAMADVTVTTTAVTQNFAGTTVPK